MNEIEKPAHALLPAVLSEVPVGETSVNIRGFQRRLVDRNRNFFHQRIGFLGPTVTEQIRSARDIRPRLGSRAESAFGTTRVLGFPARFAFPKEQHGRCPQTDDEGERGRAQRAECRLVATHEFVEPVEPARRSRLHRLVLEVMLDVERESAHRVVAALAFLLERSHRDPVEITAQHRCM
ncbi:MAG TPA: hypothetical protein VHD34_01430, partial [Xanthobacteraceae bacterium]|nr:hypothetical protein [Xanthobacteraceae bacterium]